MALPADPSKLTMGAYHPSDLPIQKRRENYMWQLSDDDDQFKLHPADDPFVFQLF